MDNLRPAISSIIDFEAKNSITSLTDEPVSTRKSLLYRLKNINSGIFLFSLPFLFFFSFGFIILASAYFLLNSDGAINAQVPYVKPTYNVYTSKPKNPTVIEVEGVLKDARAQKLQIFFSRYDAPLAYYAEDLVEAADKYGVDWRLVPAIGYCEGNGGKAIPEESCNTWGWAASEQDLAEKSGRYNLCPWENAIDVVTRGIKVGYIDKGLTTPVEIMQKYAPPSVQKGGPWAKCVQGFINEIDNASTYIP